jgi:hypothetical protein
MTLDLTTDPRVPDWLRVLAKETSLEAEILYLSGQGDTARARELEERAKRIAELGVRSALPSPPGAVLAHLGRAAAEAVPSKAVRYLPLIVVFFAAACVLGAWHIARRS